MTENEIGSVVIDAAMKVHTILGPGLLESAYAHCLGYELTNRGLAIQREIPIEVHYEKLVVEYGYRADMIVNSLVLLELKAQDVILPVHRSQLLSYIRLGRFKLGYLLNFHADHMRDGIVRMVNRL